MGIESLSAPGSYLYRLEVTYLLSGTVATAYLPYLSLSGTSMAAPVVSGTVALMLQANPALTPNAVKAILQYTAQSYGGYDSMTQGAGFLNARGAVQLAASSLAPGSRVPAHDVMVPARVLGKQTHMARSSQSRYECLDARCPVGGNDEPLGSAHAAGRLVPGTAACGTADCLAVG